MRTFKPAHFFFFCGVGGGGGRRRGTNAVKTRMNFRVVNFDYIMNITTQRYLGILIMSYGRHNDHS